MERENRNNTFNSEEEKSNMSQAERDRLQSLEAAEMADRGPKTLSPDRADTDASAMRAVSNTSGGEDDPDDDDEDDDDDLDFDEDLDDDDIVADDDDLEVNEDIEEDFTDDDLELDDDEDEDDEDEL